MSLNGKMIDHLMGYIRKDRIKDVKTSINNMGPNAEGEEWCSPVIATKGNNEYRNRDITIASFRMRLIPPEYCCGAILFEDMSWRFNDTVNPRYIASDDPIFLVKGFNRRKAVASCIQVAVDHAAYPLERSHILYYVADYQTAIAQGLKDVGFSKMSEFYNPNSGNDVYLYELKLNQDRHDDYDEDYD